MTSAWKRAKIGASERPYRNYTRLRLQESIHSLLRTVKIILLFIHSFLTSSLTPLDKSEYVLLLVIPMIYPQPCCSRKRETLVM